MPEFLCVSENEEAAAIDAACTLWDMTTYTSTNLDPNYVLIAVDSDPRVVDFLHRHSMLVGCRFP